MGSGPYQLLLPFIARNLGADCWDALSPYGYPGPIVSGAPGPADVQVMLEAAFRKLQADGCVSLFLRSHPGSPEIWPSVESPWVSSVAESATVVVDLHQPWSHIVAGFSSCHRNQIRRARRRGFGTFVDEDLSHLDDFVDLYRSHMELIGASSYYHFDDQYFDSLRANLGPDLVLRIAHLNGEIAAAALFTTRGDWSQYHLSAMAAAHKTRGLTKMVIEDQISWAKARGYRWLHLGGGRGGSSDSLFEFKSQFSDQRMRYRTAGLVLDEGSYRTLSQQRGVDPDHAGYFPAYRLPGESDGTETSEPPTKASIGAADA